jgi:hypothetical protein
MTNHTVTVNYIALRHVELDFDPVLVDAGDTIQFKRVGLPGKMQLTFTEPRFFEADFVNNGVLHEPEAFVRVKVKPPRRTTYVCELLDDAGTVVARSDGKGGGGAIDPVPGSKADAPG